MSQVKTLPITATRWLSLLLCAITAATITVFLSKVGFVQESYASWGTILHANPVLHYSAAFLAGIGIKLLLDKFYISHPKRSIGFNWRYPPVTIAVLASLFIAAFYILNTAPKLDEAALYAQSFISLKYLVLTFVGMLTTVIYQAKLYTQKPIFTAVLVALSLIYIVFAVSLADITSAFNVFMYLAASYFILAAYLLFDGYRQSKQPSITTENEDVTTQENPELNSLEDFRKWFADDRAVEHKNDLEPDLQVYAVRIYNRLLKGGDEYQKQPLAQHIALCGSFGCGKSSIVNAIANDLKTLPEKDVVWIHSDISTWGAASGSVAHVVLSNIIDDISQHIDMCAFRALPKHYTEALKSGGSVFQFASTLLAGPIDIEGSFLKLNAVLEVTNHKLLITLQDVDRGTGDENEKRLNDIAALLDKLKGRSLSHVNFIVAMGNENEVAAEVISKATDYREDIAALDCFDYLNQYTKLCLENALKPNKDRKIGSYKLVGHWGLVKLADQGEGLRDSLSSELKKLEISTSYIDSHLNSFRVLKKVLRRVEQAWQPEKLMGEVNFISLMMVAAFREVYPIQYSRYEKLATKENQLLHRWSDPESLKSKIIQICKSNDGVQGEQLKQYLGHMLGINWLESDTESNIKQATRKGLVNRASLKASTTSVIIEGKDLKNIQLNPLRLEIDRADIQSSKNSENENLVMSPKCNYLQSVGCTSSAVNYLDRIQREQLSIKEASKSIELSDQALIGKVIELRESKDILEFLGKWFDLNSEYRLGVERFFFILHCCDDLNKGLVSFFESSNSHRDSNFQDFSKNCDIELSLSWLIAENLSLENLYQAINFFFHRIEVASSKSTDEHEYVFISLIDEGLNFISEISDPTNKRIFFRELNKAENVKAHMFFCLFLISCRGKSNFDVASRIYKFDISNIKIAGESLSVLLGMNSMEIIEVSINPDIQFDNALKLNKAIEKHIKPDFNR